MNNKTEKVYSNINTKQEKKTKKLANSIKNISNVSDESNLDEPYEYDLEPPKMILNFQKIIPTDELQNLVMVTCNLKDKFNIITQDNLENRDKSNLLVKKFNTENFKIEISDETEYSLLYDFILEGVKIDISSLLYTSHIGRVIFDGYKRFLNKDNNITFNLPELLDKLKDNMDVWYQLQNIKICIHNCQGQYLPNLDDRYTYLYCLCIEGKNCFRIPIYEDKNKELVFPAMRQVNKFYFTMINFGTKDSYLDIDIQNDSLSIIIYSSSNMIKYQLTEKGICFYEEFPEYNSMQYLESIKQLEKKFLK